MSIFLIIILVFYAFLILALTFGFNKVSVFELESLKPNLKFSVVIPFRNEAENLPKLLRSLQQMHYPKKLFEIILVNDDSSDDSVEVIKQSLESTGLTFSIIENERTSTSPKKDAITAAVKLATFDWIITTDADCELPKYWLQCLNNFITKNTSDFVVAPVAYQSNYNFFNAFQILDFLSLHGTTIGAFGLQQPFLCNGANLAYKKSLFINVNGFQGNETIASGDDVFLLQKVHKLKAFKIHYLKCKDAIVQTNPVETLNELISQRIRWASKASAYNSWFPIAVAVTVLAINIGLIVTIVLAIFGIISAQLVIFIWTTKTVLDGLLLYKTARFFKQTAVLRYYAFGAIIYPFFNVFVAFSSFLKGYQWKNRPYNK